VLSAVPSGGWSVGVRPERHVGFASVIVHVAMGDLGGADLDLIANVADSHSDGAVTINRDQNVLLRNVAVSDVDAVQKGLLRRGLRILGQDDSGAVRACTGSAVCALGITTAPEAGVGLLDSRALARNSSLRVHISGCPNSCAQHQVADIGLAGSKVRVGGRTRDGYQVFLGADLNARRLAEVVGRVAESDVGAATDAIVGIWESSRRPGETLGQTVHRLGADAFAGHLEATMAERWASGPELPDDAGRPGDEDFRVPAMAAVGGG
jgi:sulfite reductase beta subunit-like hemoprotein